MIDGIDIDERTFSKLPLKQQNVVLFRNTEQLKTMIIGYKTQTRWQWGIITLLGGALAWTFEMLYAHVSK